MRQFRFEIRSILVLATVVAIFMFVTNERQRYFREHVFVTVLDQSSGLQLSEFRFRIWVVTKDSGVAPEWSEWTKHQSKSTLSIKVPAHCGLFVEVQDIGFPDGLHVKQESMLVSPEGSHQASLRIAKSFRTTGSIVDVKTREPIAGVAVAPTSRIGLKQWQLEAKTDSQGRFELYSDKPNDEICAFHPMYQYRFMRSQNDRAYAFYPGVSVRGRVVDIKSKDPIAGCVVNVMYGTGVPLTLKELSEGDLPIDDGTPAALRSKSPPRSTQTDVNGFFELSMEPLALNTKIRFEKEGWHAEHVSANDSKLAQIELSRGDYSLEGKIVDELGNPIKEFRLSTSRIGGKGIMEMGETQTDHKIRNEEGYFRVFAPRPFVGFLVRAEGYATKRFEYKQLLMQRDYSESIQLSRGVRVSGEIKKTKLHSRAVTIYLVGLESCSELSDLKSPLADHCYGDNGEIVDDHKKPWTQYEARPDLNGRYGFENIAAGRYALIVFYGDQTAALRPIEIADQNVQIPAIELPAFGRLQGILKERDRRLDPFLTSSQAKETRINPFAIYYLHRDGDPFGIPFRTDHRGRFDIEQTLVGKIRITTGGPEYSNYNREVAAFPQFVRGAELSAMSDESVQLCEILTEEIGTPWDELDSRKVLLHGPEESEGWMERDSELSRDGFRRYRVFGRVDLPSGFYSVEINDGPICVPLDIEYRRNQPPMTKMLLQRRVSAKAGRGRSGSLGGARVSLIRYGHVASRFYIPFESDDLTSCYVESTGPFDVLIDDANNGYSLLKNISFSDDSVDLGEIVWQHGASITVDVSLSGLDCFPDQVSIRHEQTGVVHCESHNWAFKNEFRNLLPGAWTVEVTGIDLLVGKRTLFEQTVELTQTDSVLLEFRRND